MPTSGHPKINEIEDLLNCQNLDVSLLYIQVHLKKIEYRGKVNFFRNLIQKVKLSYIIDSLRVK